MKDETLHNAFQNWEKLSATQEQYAAYETRMKHIFDEEAAQREAELRIREAKQETEEAKREAVEAERKAKEVDQKAKKEKDAIVRRLLAKGLDIESVADITKVSKEKVIEIQQNM